MYSNSPSSPVPVSFFAGWYAGPDDEHLPRRATTGRAATTSATPTRIRRDVRGAGAGRPTLEEAVSA